MSAFNEQATDFLKDTRTTLTINYLYTGPYFNDEVKRDVYSFTLQNKRGVYSAKFGDSLHNTEKRLLATTYAKAAFPGDVRAKATKLGLWNKAQDRMNMKEVKKAREHKPDAYDILACLSSYYPESFKEFCEEFGYSENSIEEYPRVMSIFTACQEEMLGMQKLFNEDQLELLSEIA